MARLVGTPNDCGVSALDEAKAKLPCKTLQLSIIFFRVFRYVIIIIFMYY